MNLWSLRQVQGIADENFADKLSENARSVCSLSKEGTSMRWMTISTLENGFGISNWSQLRSLHARWCVMAKKSIGERYCAARRMEPYLNDSFGPRGPSGVRTTTAPFSKADWMPNLTASRPRELDPRISWNPSVCRAWAKSSPSFERLTTAIGAEGWILRSVSATASQPVSILPCQNAAINPLSGHCLGSITRLRSVQCSRRITLGKTVRDKSRRKRCITSHIVDAMNKQNYQVELMVKPSKDMQYISTQKQSNEHAHITWAGNP